MPKKSWYSATVIFVIFARCVVFGAENAGDTNETKVDTPLISIAPIEVNIPPIKVLPVKVNVQPIKLSSVKVQNPVKAEIQKPEAITVNAQTEGDKSLTVYVKKDWLTFVIAFATAVVAFATALAAGFAYRSSNAAARSAKATQDSVEATKNLAEGELFRKLIWEYSSPEMRHDFNIVFNWKKEKWPTKPADAEQAAKEWTNQLDSQDKSANDLDKARRHITHFFLNIWELDNGSYTRKGFAEKVCKTVSTGVLDVVLPLEAALIRHIGMRDKWERKRIREEMTKLKKKFQELKELSGNKPFR